ncbi:MAG: EscU/YscU/HrcU family type III secretion system export apparatus switch protein [Nitrospinota bacterium]
MKKKRIQKAVALKYEKETERAPKVAAKGKGKIAEKILEIAKEHGIPVHEDADLLEVLSQLDIDQEIPPYLYTVVAELLAFIYRINGEGTAAAVRAR